MRTLLKFLAVILIIAVIVTGYVFWQSSSAITGAETSLDGRLNTLIGFYATLDTQYVGPMISVPDLSSQTLSSLDSVHQTLVPLASPPATFDGKLALLMKAQKQIRQLVSTQGLEAGLTDSSAFQQFSKESSNLGQASALLKDYNQAVGFFNAQLLSRTGKLISQWSSLQRKQFLNIDGTLSTDTVISFQ